MSTLRVNFYGGPGTGKSTTAAFVFAELKKAGVNTELITEHAKDLTWENNQERLAYQPIIAAEQQWMEHRVEGKVDVLVSDTATFLSVIYDNGKMTQLFLDWVVEEYKQARRLNVFLTRNPNRAYNPAGRNQTQDEAEALDNIIQTKLTKYGVDYVTCPILEDFSHVQTILELIEHER
jgi:predicted ATPase